MGNGRRWDDVTEEAGTGELRQARLEIARLRAEAARLARQADDAKRLLRAERAKSAKYAEQVRELRRSSSWRLTKPVRAVKRRVASLRRGR